MPEGAEQDVALGGKAGLTLADAQALPCRSGATTSVGSEVRRVGWEGSSLQSLGLGLTSAQPYLTGEETQRRGQGDRKSGGRRTQPQACLVSDVGE